MAAKLRVCARCEWIFKSPTDQGIWNEVKFVGCPKCGFAHYGARSVYGKSAYRYSVTQQPWLDKKVSDYTLKLFQEIRESRE